MRKCCFLALLSVLVFCSCNNRNKIKEPQVFLDEQQMIDLLTDSYLIEADLTQKRSSGVEVAPLQKAYYEQLFEHYEITDTIFQENMNYYTYHPDILERMMDSVMNRFIKAQQ